MVDCGAVWPLFVVATCGSSCHLMLGYQDDPGASETDPTETSSRGGSPRSGPAGSGGAGAAGDTSGATASGGDAAGGGGGQEGGGQGGAGGSCRHVAESDFVGNPPLGPADEDFASATMPLARWGARFFVVNEGGYQGPVPSTAMLCPGALRIRAGQPGDDAGYAWFDWGTVVDQSGPFVYQPVQGNFAIEVDVEVESTGLDPNYSGAGIVVRNPGQLNHFVYYNLSVRGDSQLATQVRLRDPSGTAGMGRSFTMDSPEVATAWRGRLLVCRIGGSFSFHRRLDDEASPQYEGATSGDLNFGTVLDVEVGLSAHWFEHDGTPFEGVFRTVRFHPVPPSHAACTALLE